jgi:hypothetical protein
MPKPSRPAGKHQKEGIHAGRTTLADSGSSDEYTHLSQEPVITLAFWKEFLVRRICWGPWLLDALAKTSLAAQVVFMQYLHTFGFVQNFYARTLFNSGEPGA